MKIPPVRAELFDADGQTGSHEKTLFFCSFANASKNDKA